MSTPGGRDVMLQRHEIVVRIIDINSRALRIENESNGLDIERRNAERDCSQAPSSQTDEALAAIHDRIQQLDASRKRLVAEKTWLEQALDNFDNAARNKPADRAESDPRRHS